MSSIAETAAKAHLRLAEGFITAAAIEGNPTEYEVRNAFSRLYYALFHASKGYLWANGFDVGGLGHGSLHNEMARCMGKAFSNFVRASYELRRMSDYTPEWAPPPIYGVMEKLKLGRTQFYYLLSTARNLLRDRKPDDNS